MMIRVSGAALGLLAFAITIGVGLYVGNPAEVILLRAIQALFVFCLLGLSVGWIAKRLLDEHACFIHQEMLKNLEKQSAGPVNSDDESATESDTGDQGVMDTAQVADGQ